jgi:dUTP pyrophosphatase
MNNQLKILRIDSHAVIPDKGSFEAAGYDLYSIEENYLSPGQRKLFRTGIKLAIPLGLYARIAPRSGLAFKKGIDVMAGVVDSDYTGEISVILINLGQEHVKISKGDKIAQMIFEHHTNMQITEILNEQDLKSTQRGSKGFGSTD